MIGLGCSLLFSFSSSVISKEKSTEVTCTCDPVSDSLVLVEFYEATDGGNWDTSDYWLTSAPMSEWHGISVNLEGCVENITLENNSLSGVLIPNLTSLEGLKILNLWENNGIIGEIPDDIGALGNLELLNLWNSSISGDIPPSIGDLEQLGLLAIKSSFLQQWFIKN